MLNATVWTPAMMTFVVFYFDLDFLHLIFPASYNSLGFIIVRIASELVFVYTVWEVVCSTFSILILVCEFGVNISDIQQRQCFFLTQSLFGHNPFNVITTRLFRLNSEIYIFFLICSLVVSVFLPCVLLLGTAMIVIGNYGTIKLYCKTSWSWYLMFPEVSIVLIVFLLFAYTKAAEVYETSVTFKQNIMVASKSKWLRKKAASVRPARISVGGMFHLKTETK